MQENLLKYLSLLLFFGLSLFPVLSSAQSRDSLAPIDLGEVLLNHRLKDFTKHSSPVPVQSVSGENLERMNSLNVADAIRYFSGVQLKDYGGVGGIKTVNVRSMGSEHTGVFYDGIQLGNAQNGQIDLGKFSLANMEQVSLYQGQSTDLEQSAKAYASANSIYLRTRTPEFRDSTDLDIQAGFKTGSFGLVNPSLNVDLGINKDLALRVSSEVIRADGKYRFQYSNGIYDTTAIRNNADMEALRIETSLFGQHDNGTEWNIKYYHYNSERGLPGAIVANRFARPQRLWDRNDFIQGMFRYQVHSDFSFKIRGKYADNYSRYRDPEIITTTGVLNNEYYQQEYYFSLAGVYNILPFWKLALATDFQQNLMQANLYRFAYPKRISVLSALTSEFDFNRLTLQAGILSTGIYETVKYYQGADDYQEYTPNIMASWQPLSFKGLRLRAFYKKIFRMPTFNDLYYTFSGNTFLNPEYSEQINLGVSIQHETGGLLVEVSSDIYKIWITDKIVAVPGANLFRWTMLNLGEVETSGLETNFSLTGRALTDLQYHLRVGYTYQEAVDRTTNSNSYGDQIPYIPVHSGNTSAMLSYKDWNINYSFIYTGERYSQKANIPSNYLQPWYTHDISINYKLELWRNTLKAGVEINNLLDQQYAVIKNFPMPGRSFRINFNYQL